MIRTIVLLIYICIVSSCTYTATSSPNDSNLTTEPFSGTIISPSLVVSGIEFPIIIKDDNHVNRFVHVADSIQVHMNRGYGTVALQESNNIVNKLNQSGSVIKLDTIKETITGEWPDSLLSISNGVYRITGNVTISQEKTVTLTGPVTIIIDNLVNITNNGTIITSGTDTSTVAFLSSEPSKPWGGIINNNIANFTHTIFSGGGGNTADEYVDGHSHSQATVHTAGGESHSLNCYYVHNVGKGGTARWGTVTIDSSLTAFCDMGGEYHSSKTTISNSHFQFFPNDDFGEFVDDDNDALYISGKSDQDTNTIFTVISNTYIGYGKDDGIDHNGACINVDNVDIEHFYNEGIACSNTNIIRINNSRISHCEQGVEAGYHEPTVFVNHTEILFNDIGIRFGDSYDWGCNGRITVSNSIIQYNRKNYFNLDYQTGTAKDSLVEINYSIIDVDSIYNGSNNYLTTIPLNSDSTFFIFNSLEYPSSDPLPVGRYEI